jgi:predicted dinucleotide-binding enzyme
LKIGIIGVGNLGGTLARKLSAAGHTVLVANSKGAEAITPFAKDIGATPTDVYGAVQAVDLIVVSVPFHSVASLPKDLFKGVPSTVPVVDTTNYYPGMLSPQIAEIDGGMTESVWVARQLGRPVIKAFNNIIAASLADLGRPVGSPDRIAIAVAGDDEDAKRVVMGIVNDVGFDPVDAGSLDESWRQEPATPAYCCDYDVAETRKGLAAAENGKARAKLADLPEVFAKLGANPNHGDIIAANRALCARS